MQSVSVRIWTRVAVSISYDTGTHYYTGISTKIKILNERMNISEHVLWLFSFA